MRNFTLAILCSFLSVVSYGQIVCGFDNLHEMKLKTDPAYARMIEANNASIRKYIDQQLQTDPRFRVSAAIYTIPVVVHVMHTGGSVGSIYNPTDAQILGAIDYLNQVYAGTYSGMTPQNGASTVNDIQVQFALAQRSPTCGATNGIDRVDASSIPNYTANGVRAATTTGCTDTELKNFARWNTANYYNIYVVNKIDGADGTSGQFIAGYATFPGAGNSDGTVMLATQMKTGEKTLPHEIGHALNLYHTFQGSNDATTCPVNNNCANDGDLICDTDPITNNVNSGVYNFTCRTGTNTCPLPNQPYTVNTESNFMSYTNCYTLFTADQKSRMLAAMSLPGRASLVSGSNMSLVPCGTIINFLQATAIQSENAAGTTTGCRTYTDYNFQMVIGAAPSATATATLSYTGSANQGVDYDVTTNGDFNSPSNVLSFASGATAAQPFTVRIYDDAAVESPENIVIDFTVNNGGGNAAKGTSAPTFTFTINNNEMAPVAGQTTTFTIGSAVYGQQDAPFDATLQKQRGQYLYKASELTAAGISAGTINSLALNVLTKLTTRPFTNFTIKMGQIAINNLVDGSYTSVSGLTTVYTSASYASTAGWNTFTLSTPFAWNGTSSIVYEVCYDNGTAAPADDADVIAYYPDGSSSSQGNFIFQNDINCSGSFTSVSYYPQGIKPMIRLNVAITGTPVENTASATNTIYVGNGSNDYFYSSPGNKLLAGLQNVNATLGCVTAALDAAGTTWQSYSGGQRSAKIFAITPTQNVSTTSYTISLYFNNAELGGKTASSLKIAKTTAASVAGANGSNTILVTPTVTTLGANVTVFTASFTGFSRFFLVDNAVALPIGLVDFKGRVTNDQNALLEWKTSYEKNNARFEIETSRDGSGFAQLDQVNSKGDADFGHSYIYLHARPVKGVNHYRLKQVDIDGRSTYSNVIHLTIDGNANPKPFLSPNPAREMVKVNFAKINASPVQLEILSADLKSVRSETAGTGSIYHSLEINQLPAGVYFIRMIIAGKTEVLRFVKE